MLYLHFKTFKL